MFSEKIFRQFPIIFVCMLIMLGASTVNAEVKTFTGVGKYIMSDFDSQTIAKERAKVRAEKDAKEKAGVYLTGFARTVNSKLTQQEILAITNNIISIVGDIKYSQEIFNVDNSNKSQVVEWTANLITNIDTNGINDWLKRDDKSKVTIIEQNENVRKAQDENDKQFEALKNQYDNATNQQDKDRIKTKIEQIDIEFLAIQKLEEGKRFYYNNEYDKAIAVYNEAIELNPKYASAYNNRGNAYYHEGEYDKAIADYNRALELNPNYVDAYNNRGLAYGEKGDNDKAIDEYNRALELNPKYSPAYNNRGIVYGKKGYYDKAIADFTRAIELESNNIDAYNNRGLAYEKKGDYDKTIADYTRALELKPNDVDVYNNRGNAYYKKGDYDNAIADYNRALELNPNFVLAYNNRGVAYEKKGYYDKAIADYNRALELNPNFAEAYNNRGIAYAIKGEYDLAIADFKKVLEINPNDPVSLEALKILLIIKNGN